MELTHLLVAIFASCQAAAAYVIAQTPLGGAVRPPLRGRFLHITDIHPDPYYRTDASVSSACHRKKPKNEPDRAGYWGTPWSGCDTPLRLMNLTFDFLDDNWAEQIDFVIWTGDSARHDNDRKHPRTPSEIYELNRQVTSRMEDIFGRRGIPVIPTLGNNDVWPHNILAAGPNPITNAFVNIWQSFIPFSSYQVFQRGAYFSVEVISNKLAVISLNTMYFYDSNKAVRGCEYKIAEDPGNLQFDWLDVQLGLFRKRKMQVYLMGHVAPSPGNYFPECFRRYAEVSLRFQDTIVGHIYGHANVDHFSLLNADDLLAPPVSAGIQKSIPLDKALHEEFSQLPKQSKTNEDDYAIINVSPSVVTNPYVPSFRVFSYNITNEDEPLSSNRKKEKRTKKKHNHSGRKTDCTKKKNRDSWACRPQKPRHADPSSPSRSNTLWTPLGYAQYYMPDIERSNSSRWPTWELEYLTYRVSALHPPASSKEAEAFTYPVPVHLLPTELRNSSLKESAFAPYEMDDLTVGSWLRLARRLVKKKGLWKRFKRLMYSGG